MVRIVISFLIGILIAIFFPNSMSIATGIALLTIGMLIYVLLFTVLRKKLWGNTAGILGLSIIMLLGFAQTLITVESKTADHLINYQGPIESYQAEIVKPAKEKKRRWQYEVLIEKINDGKSWRHSTGTVLLYITKESQSPPFFYGDKLAVRGAPQLLNPPTNPHVFNFKRFLKFKNIYHQHFVSIKHALLVAAETHKDIKYYAYKARAWATNKIKTYVSNNRAQAIALALTLGVSNSIDNDLRKAYAASGAMHVLAVSGLHVGIIYGIIMLIGAPLRSQRWGQSAIAVISITILWFYAFLTGLSPSVLRAVTMFSFIALAQLLGRKATIYNTLAGSAFLLLLFNPYLIMSVGFQLSYLAVLGIVSIYRSLYLLWEPQSTLVDWIWRATCVSMAAQLSTFALGLLYFHQLPVYFLFANLFILPGAMCILIGSLLIIATSAVSPIASLLGLVLQKLISLLNMGIFAIEKLPFSVIDGIYITPLQCVLLIMITLFCILLLKTKRYYYLVIAFICTTVFASSRWMYFYNEVLQKRLVVYAVPRHTVVEWIDQGTSYLYSDKLLVEESVRFNILPNRLFCGVRTAHINYIHTNESEYVKIFYKHGKLVAIVNRPIHSWPDQLHIDYLIVGNNAFRSIEEMQKIFPFNRLILSSSNSKWLCERMIQEDKKAITYSVLHQGAYVEKI